MTRCGGRSREDVRNAEPPVGRVECGAAPRRLSVAPPALDEALAANAEAPLHFVPLLHHLQFRDCLYILSATPWLQVPTVGDASIRLNFRHKLGSLVQCVPSRP